MAYYNRPALELDEQISHLKIAGLDINSEENLKKVLSRISFYRFKEYLSPLLQDQTAITEKDVTDLYVFDHRLRMTLFEAIKVIEIALRTQVIQTFATKFGPFGYTDPENFRPGFQHEDWLKKAQREIIKKKNSHLSIRHYYNQYENKYLPLWAFAEYATFGSLSLMIKGMHTEERKAIARFFHIPHTVLINWIHVLVYIRNICAHHARLWNLELRIPPVRLEKDLEETPREFINNNRVFSVVNIVLHILNAIESPVSRRYQKNLIDAVYSAEKLPLPRFFEFTGFITEWEKSNPWRLPAAA